MKDNFQNESKTKWTQIFRKKWFFPALYLMLAAILVTGVIWFQNVEKQLSKQFDMPDQADSYMPNLSQDEAEPVSMEKEMIMLPVQAEVETEIVTKFYDFDAELEVKEQALTLYNKRYYQSTGIDIVASDGGAFDVVAALSGTVVDVQEKALHGNVVTISHGNDIKTNYSSLTEVTVAVGDKVSQGDKLGVAGNNLFGQENGTHVHFEISKADQLVNPEAFVNQSVMLLEQLGSEAEPDQSVHSKEAEDSEETEEDSKETPSDAPKEDSDEEE